ncbi:hypothetical protein HHK36_011403 [Tetracentron sinense]|uniref:Uncharacterized protein n=1 Tax=Tetracentron sinense TaxID=13715 RepID=A0A834ZBS6_TETSI|nr:hypothetical protein HHK36_011403 [Tetracentron sinense]
MGSSLEKTEESSTHFTITEGGKSSGRQLLTYLVNGQYIKPLCDLLVCPDPRIVIACLEGLENILKIGEAEENSGNTGGVYAQLIDDAEGLEQIDNLQS